MNVDYNIVPIKQSDKIQSLRLHGIRLNALELSKNKN